MTHEPQPICSICVLPWMHLGTTVDGIWTRCCYDASAANLCSEDVSQHGHGQLPGDIIGCTPLSKYAAANSERVTGIADAFNSPAMRMTRLEMLDGRFPSACRLCYETEEKGFDSHRLRMNRDHAALLDPARCASVTGVGGHVDRAPMSLDIRLGNTCNLRCIMCSFPISSAWGALDRARLSGTHIIDPYTDDPAFWTELWSIAPYLEKVYLAGGEPLLQRSHHRFLQVLIDAGAANSISLHYNTNLTVLPRNIFDTLAHFKRVVFGASCDGVGAVFEGIRSGAKWPTFVANLQIAKQRVDIELDVTVQRANVTSLADIVDFAQAQHVDVTFKNVLYLPRHLSIAYMSQPEISRAEHHVQSVITSVTSPTITEDLTNILAILRRRRDPL